MSITSTPVKTSNQVGKGNEENKEPFPWSIENEIHLLYAMKNRRPVGVHGHFQMMFINEILDKRMKQEIHPDVIWAKLDTMYDMEALDDNEIPPKEVVTQRDFELPYEFQELTEKKKKESPEVEPFWKAKEESEEVDVAEPLPTTTNDPLDEVIESVARQAAAVAEKEEEAPEEPSQTAVPATTSPTTTVKIEDLPELIPPVAWPKKRGRKPKAHLEAVRIYKEEYARRVKLGLPVPKEPTEIEPSSPHVETETGQETSDETETPKIRKKRVSKDSTSKEGIREGQSATQGITNKRKDKVVDKE